MTALNCGTLDKWSQSQHRAADTHPAPLPLKYLHRPWLFAGSPLFTGVQGPSSLPPVFFPSVTRHHSSLLGVLPSCPRLSDTLSLHVPELLLLFCSSRRAGPSSPSLSLSPKSQP